MFLLHIFRHVLFAVIPCLVCDSRTVAYCSRLLSAPDVSTVVRERARPFAHFLSLPFGVAPQMRCVIAVTYVLLYAMLYYLSIVHYFSTVRVHAMLNMNLFRNSMRNCFAETQSDCVYQPKVKQAICFFFGIVQCLLICRDAAWRFEFRRKFQSKHNKSTNHHFA